jgi:MraZ protein
VFRGSFEHLIDQKGRVSVPSRFREIVLSSGSPQVFLTRFSLDSARCLDAYPISEWDRFEEQFQRLKHFDRNVILFENFYIGNAQGCEIDSQGRILVPPSLRQWAGLSKDVVFSGAGHKFRLWDRNAWDQVQAEAEVALRDTDFLNKLNL